MSLSDPPNQTGTLGDVQGEQPSGLSAGDALKAIAASSFSRWSFPNDEKNIDQKLGINRLFNGRITFAHKPKFKIKATDLVFTIGSCFAREIEVFLIRKDISVVTIPKSMRDAPIFALKPGVALESFFNRYNLPSMCDEIENLADQSHLETSSDLTYQALGAAKGVLDDLHYTPAAHPGALEVVLDRRAAIKSVYSEGIRNANVVIITLGLNEAWYDSDAKKFLNVVSSPQLLRRLQDKLSLRFITFGENYAYLKRIVALLGALGDKKIILTVSPVPLEATYTGTDILLANFAAKAMLQAVAREAATIFENVDYFPSFEMATFSQQDLVWKSDGRHVQADMVHHIVDQFLRLYLSTMSEC